MIDDLRGALTALPLPRRLRIVVDADCPPDTFQAASSYGELVATLTVPTEADAEVAREVLGDRVVA